MLGFAGVTVIDVSTAGVTVSVAMLEITPLNVALMVVVPSETAVANPFEPAALLIVTAPVFEEDQIAHVVNVCIMALANVPVAVNCWVVPLAMLVVIGDTAIDDTSAEVSCVLPVVPLKAAEIVAVPVVDPAVARPLMEMPAILVSLELQSTKAEIFCVAVLARVPVAAYWMVVPDAIVWFAGVTSMDARSELVRTVEPEMPTDDALIVVVPVEDNTALTSPPGATAATAVLLEAHVTDDVRFCLEPFEKVPCAIN